MWPDVVTVGPEVDDLTARPWEYPGRAPQFSGLLACRRYRRLRPAGPGSGEWLAGRSTPTTALNGSSGVSGRGRGRRTGRQAPTLRGILAAAGVAPLEERTLVVAVGSNASPAVLQRKLTARGVDATVPFLRVELTGLRAGHSAHVSRAGFVAATPVLEHEATTTTFGCLLDEHQLRCIDDTEPNYTRRTVDADTCRCAFEDESAAASFEVYDSTWGALTPPGALPTPLGSQSELYEEVLAGSSPFSAVVGGIGGDGGADGHRVVMERLAGDVTAREAVRDAWREQGWSRPGGFG